MKQSVQKEYGCGIASRFVPFVTMHEFEGLLFSKPEEMADGMGVLELAQQFQDTRSRSPTPEHINDISQKAPSKHVIDLMPKYEKFFKATWPRLALLFHLYGMNAKSLTTGFAGWNP